MPEPNARLAEAFERIAGALEATMPSPKNRNWKLLNEPFTLWALSMFLLGLFGFVYSQVSTGLVIRAENERAIAKLQAQTGVRLEYSELLLQRADDPRKYSDALEALLYDTPTTSLYPDFRDRSTLSLLWELTYRTNRNRQESERTHEGMLVVTEIVALRDRLQNAPASERGQLVQQVRKKIAELDKM